MERRQGEPIKSLFLPKMVLFGSQASTIKKRPILNNEQLLSSVFSNFHWHFFFLFSFTFCSVRSKKLLHKKVKKRVSPWLLSTISLFSMLYIFEFGLYWAVLGRIGPYIGPNWAVYWAVLGRILGRIGPYWAVLGRILGHTGSNWAILGYFFE